MADSSFETPVLFLIFNRPDTTKKVFEAIRQMRPKQLFIAADGPRKNKEGEFERCEAVRKIVIDNIDWDCEVKTLFRERNLGCRGAVSNAITWFFENVEAGIILEDDCLPHPSFFNFCQIMLSKYENDKRIMQICGTSYDIGSAHTSDSYFFSKLPKIWGWATWKRAWDQYDVNIDSWNDESNKLLLKNRLKLKGEYSYWEAIFNRTFEKAIDTWDYQWVYCVFKAEGMCIVPFSNLISNLGCYDGTHTKNNKNDPNANRPTKDIGSILHPANVGFDETIDNYVSNFILKVNPSKRMVDYIPNRLKQALKRLLK